MGECDSAARAALLAFPSYGIPSEPMSCDDNALQLKVNVQHVICM